MKNKIKALALALALVNITACSSSKAQNTGRESFDRSSLTQNLEQEEVRVANVGTPKAKAIKVEKEDKRSYLIPQTLEAKEKVEEVKEEKEDSLEVEEETYQDNEIQIIDQDEEVEEDQDEEVEENYDGEDPILAQDNFAVEQVAYQAEVEQVEYLDFDDVDYYDTVSYEDIDNLGESYDYYPEEVQEEAYYEDYDYQLYQIEEVEEETAKPIEEDYQEMMVDEPDEYVETQAKDQQSSGLTIESPSASEIKSYWFNYQTRANDKANFLGLDLINQDSPEVYDKLGDANSLTMGKLSKAAKEDALHIVNTARFASGISELSLDDKYSDYAQAASFVNMLNNTIDHYPSLPRGLDQNSNIYQMALVGAANSNIGAGVNILDAALEYAQDDLGQLNQREVGHRRWLLNPASSQVGFGQTDQFSAMYVNNDNYQGQNANSVYAYPGQVAISEFHAANSSLSLMFGENFDLSGASVEVRDLATGQVSTDSYIDQSFKGNSKAITFGYGMGYQPGTKLEVKVSGVLKDGQEYPVSYTIEYISLN